MPFKHGSKGALWLNGVDVSGYFASADWGAKVAAAETSTLQSSWKTFIPGVAESTLAATGYYDSLEADKVRATLQVDNGVATYFPAGAVVVGDLARLMFVETTDYKTGSKVGGAITLDWTANSSATVGIGVCLHPLGADSVGTNNGTGDGVMTSLQSTTGAVATLHVTAYTSGASTVKFQDCATIGGVYVDIAGGAFATISGIGAQRIVISGTIRQFVRCVSVVVTSPLTFGASFART